VNFLQTIIGYLTAPFRVLLKGPTYLITAPRRIWGMSPPARAAALVGLALALCTIAIVLIYKFVDPDRVNEEILEDPLWIASVIFVNIATPTATYFFVKLWLEGDVSLYPDIDRAWDEGVAALAEKGIQLKDYPLFLILGAANEAACDALFDSGKVRLTLAGAPKGQTPLHWYASEQGIFLALTGTGRLGRLAQLAVAAPGSARGGGGGGGAPITATMVVGGGAMQNPFASSTSPFDSDAPGGGGGGAILGTLMASPGEWVKTDGGQAAPAPRSSSGMSHGEGEEQTARLEYVLRRLRRARQPYCADNGILTVLPHPAINDIVFAKEIPPAVRADLESHYAATNLASSVTALVTGMEVEEGFTELVRRVGMEHAKNGRFGKGFDVWNLATDENMDALSSHACGSFEDWVYKLFSTDDGMEHRSNGKLFAMLCWVRRHLQPRLRNVLVGGYATDHEDADSTPRLFSGCYFAATGRQGESQAFVRSVFDKLDQLAGDLQWSDAALREEATYSWITRLLTLINAVLLVAAVFLGYQCIVDLLRN
jgi:hypothetical protein